MRDCLLAPVKIDCKKEVHFNLGSFDPKPPSFTHKHQQSHQAEEQKQKKNPKISQTDCVRTPLRSVLFNKTHRLLRVRNGCNLELIRERKGKSKMPA